MFRRAAASETVDQSWKGVYRAAGIAMVATGVLYFIGMSLGSVIGPPPSSGEDYLSGLAANTTVAQALFWTFALTDFLLVPGMLALYLVLKGVNKNAMFLATALLGIYIIFDLAVTETASLTLVALIQQDAAATTDTQRAAYAAAADYARATLPMATFLSWLVGCIGWLIVNVVMLRGSFYRAVAALGIAFSIEGIIGSGCFLVPALAVLLNPALVTFGVWSIFVGIRLTRLGKRTTTGQTLETHKRTTSI